MLRNDMCENMCVDSDMSQEEALAQNQQSPAPIEILRMMHVLPVLYYDFSGRIHGGQIVIHTDVVDDVKKFFELAFELRFPFKSIIPICDARYAWSDELSCEGNNSSGYNYRVIAGTDRLSKHALGRAFDVNPMQNVYVRYDTDMKVISQVPKNGTYDVDARGTLTAEHPLVLLMKKRGWIWGGDWTPESGRVDYQHFEK